MSGPNLNSPPIQLGQEESPCETSTDPATARADGYGAASTESPSTEELLFAAMDRAARSFIDLLNDDSRDEDGELKISIEMRFKLFDKGQDWLMKRQKLRPASEEREGAGITDMRASMQDPKIVEMLDQVMYERGYVKVPEKKTGRPSNADKPVRERYKSFRDNLTAAEQRQDDSGWQKALSATPPEEES